MMTKNNLTLWLLGSIVLGTITGLVFKDHAAWLGIFGKILIQMIKALTAPLLFFAIIDSFVQVNVRGKDLLQMLKIMGLNAFAALVIALVITNSFKAGALLDLSSFGSTAAPGDIHAPSLQDFLEKLIPTSFLGPFVENNILSIAMLAVLLGFGIKAAQKENGPVSESSFKILQQYFSLGFKTFEKILSWITRLVPLAIFGITAKTVGEKGLSSFTGVIAFFVVCVIGLLAQTLLVYQAWVIFYLKIPLKHFWSAIKEALIYSFGVNSSLASLHLTLAATQRLGASNYASRLVACVGTNLNNDGILLYEAVAVLFIAQAYHIDLSLGQQLLVMVTCIVGTLGVSGVPEAGIISLTLVLGMNHLPVDALPVLLTVDWFIARMRSSTNVFSDILCSVVLDKKLSQSKKVLV